MKLVEDYSLLKNKIKEVKTQRNGFKEDKEQ